MPPLLDERVKAQREFDYVVGSNIRTLRIQNEIKQLVLARAAGMSTSQLSRVENGQRSLTFRQAVSIAKQLGTTLDRLLRPIQGLPDPNVNRGDMWYDPTCQPSAKGEPVNRSHKARRLARRQHHAQQSADKRRRHRQLAEQIDSLKNESKESLREIAIGCGVDFNTKTTKAQLIERITAKVAA